MAYLHGQATMVHVAEEKNPAAVALSKLGSSKGGHARAAKLSPQKRSEIARLAAKARWANTPQRRRRTLPLHPVESEAVQTIADRAGLTWILAARLVIARGALISQSAPHDEQGIHRMSGLSSAIADSGVWAELTDAIRDQNDGNLPWGKERALLEQMVAVVTGYITDGSAEDA